MMSKTTNLYIDESGNTGETLSIDGKFNFTQQPYYILAGLILMPDLETITKEFIERQKQKHNIQSLELKAKNLYDNKPKFIEELVDFITCNNIPAFIEIMDKVYYLNIQIVQYFLLSFSSELTDESIAKRQFLVSNIGRFLNPQVYQQFVDAVKMYTNESLEAFYDQLILHFHGLNSEEGNFFKVNVEKRRQHYFQKREINREQALKKFFPIPDENPQKRLIHLLPNYNALTGLLARAEKYRNISKLGHLSITHDEQKQFDVIFQSALNGMKSSNTDELVKNTKVNDIAIYDIGADTRLEFLESKSSVFLQIADVIAGFTMRFWADFIAKNYSTTDHYLNTFNKLVYPIDNSPEGINFVVPDFDHYRLIHYGSFRH